MTFRIIDDTIELDGLPVATILPSVWPTKRDYLEQSLNGWTPDDPSELAEALSEIEDLKREIEDLREELEANQ